MHGLWTVCKIYLKPFQSFAKLRALAYLLYSASESLRAPRSHLAPVHTRIVGWRERNEPTHIPAYASSRIQQLYTCTNSRIDSGLTQYCPLSDRPNAESTFRIKFKTRLKKSCIDWWKMYPARPLFPPLNRTLWLKSVQEINKYDRSHPVVGEPELKSVKRGLLARTTCCMWSVFSQLRQTAADIQEKKTAQHLFDRSQHSSKT